MRSSYRMVPGVYQVFWTAMQRGQLITDAAAEAGTYRKQGTRWLFAAGGVRPRRGRDLKGRCLTLAQREEIAVDGVAAAAPQHRRAGMLPGLVSSCFKAPRDWTYRDWFEQLVVRRLPDGRVRQRGRDGLRLVR
jgi:hypothetical protein